VRRTLSLVTALAVTALGSVAAAPAHADQGYTTTYESIPGDGSTPIRAFVVKPDGNGPFPLLVMPSSWSLLDGEYLGAAHLQAPTPCAVRCRAGRCRWTSASSRSAGTRPPAFPT
jgi:hypothetical protein